VPGHPAPLGVRECEIGYAARVFSVSNLTARPSLTSSLCSLPAAAAGRRHGASPAPARPRPVPCLPSSTCRRVLPRNSPRASPRGPRSRGRVGSPGTPWMRATQVACQLRG